MALPKFQYKSKEFCDNLEKLAKQGFTDTEIAFSLGLSPETFWRKKAKIRQISQALSRGRHTINQVIRQKYIALGIGGVKTKAITKKKTILPDGSIEDGDVIYEVETELPPNERVLANWLALHDDDWKQKTLELKKLDLTTNGKDINGTQLIFASTPLSEKDIQEIKDIQNGSKEDSTNPGISET